MIVKQLKVSRGDKFLIPGDIHFPLHDPDLLSLLCSHSGSWGVGGVILIGDTFDCFGLSRHQKNAAQAATRGSIAREVAAAKPWLARLGEGMKYREALTGNHEDWFDDLVDENPALEGMTWDYAYSGALTGWNVRPYGTALKVGKLLVTHGCELAGSLSKHSAKSVLGNYPGQNTMYGHTHRVDVATAISYKYGKQEKHSAWTIGHSRDPDVVMSDKVQRSWARSWEQGFALLTITGDDGSFNVDIIRPFKHNGGTHAFVEGKLYSSTSGKNRKSALRARRGVRIR